MTYDKYEKYETSPIRFAASMRGQYIIGQALCLAIEKLNEVEPAIMREQSNIEDMEYLRDNLSPSCPLFSILHDETV